MPIRSSAFSTISKNWRNQRFTWSLIDKASQANAKRVHGVKLSRNVGHQNALLARLLAQIGKADAVISLDADLQDDISIVARMIEQFENGAEIVFAVRQERSTDSWFKRGTADLYYRMLNWLGPTGSRGCTAKPNTPWQRW